MLRTSHLVLAGVLILISFMSFLSAVFSVRNFYMKKTLNKFITTEI